MPETVNLFGWQLTGDEARAATFGGLFLLAASVALLISIWESILEEFRHGDGDGLSDRRIDHSVDGDVKAGE